MKRLAAILLAGGMIAGADGATVLTKSGSEYRIIPTLPGDQVQVHLALGDEGGYLVTQDNSIDGNGLGIRARKFYGNLSSAQGTFQVNANGTGDQQNARVALLREGGAVFAWESSTAAGHRVMVRFLDGNDVFTGEEVSASRVAGGSQSDPAVAVLAGGNVVVIWAEWDRDGSMDGIFGQLFTPGGARSGSTFQVNVKSQLSQRTPAITALDNGGFAVAWITDENRHPNSIDIYARVFNADGAAATGEFPANTWKTRVNDKGQNEEVVEVCANPYLAAIPGGFRAAWSERTMIVSESNWDVVTRTFNANGEAQSGEAIVNNTTKGDQFSPKIAQNSGVTLIVWTSFGQDGSDEGIYGRALNSSGGFDGDEFLVNTRTISRQIFPAITAAGSRFVAAWSSFVGGVASYDLFAQVFSVTAPAGLTAPAAPFASGLSQNSICVTWAEESAGASYLVYVDDEAPIATTQGMATVTRDSWQPGSSHTVKLAYKTPSGETSPLSAPVAVNTWGVDANGDGLPDDWQQLNFGKLRPGASVDTDGDGASNLEEFLAGTDPTDPASILRTALTSREQGLYIEWNTIPGNYYQLQVTSDFQNWTNVGTPRFAHSNLDSLPCTGPGQVRYYRVIRMR